MGISCNGISLGGWSEISYTQLLTNQSQNRDFLVIGQKVTGVMDVLFIPVRAASGAISFITGTYHNPGSCQYVETINEAEARTI